MLAEIPKTMKAVQLVGVSNIITTWCMDRRADLVHQQYKQKYEIKDIPVPKIGDNDVLIKVGAAGFCHTDYQVWEGVYESPCPIVPSHEPVGTIVAVGPAAQGKWKAGQRAGVLLFRHACKTCVGCKVQNDIRFCENADFAGLKADGGFADYIIGDGDNIVAIPDSISFEQAAPLMCAGVSISEM